MESDENSNSDRNAQFAKGMALQFFNQQVVNKVMRRVKEVAVSYAHKDKDMDNATWIKNELVKYGVDEEKAAGISTEIISGIEHFTKTTKEIDDFCAAGNTKEKWLSSFIDKNTAQDIQQKGAYLEQVDVSLAAGNEAAEKIIKQNAMPEIFADFERVIDVTTSANSEKWNIYTVSKIKDDIAQQTNLMNATSLSEPVTIPDSNGAAPILQGILDDSETGDFTSKMLTSVAMKVSAVADNIPFLNVLPIPALTNMACVGVESVKNIVNVARGKIKPLEALEKTGRATVAATANFIKSGFPAMLLSPIPGVGVPLSISVGGYLRSLSGEKIQEQIYAGIAKVKPIAEKVAVQIKITSRKFIDTTKLVTEKFTTTVKETFDKVLSWFSMA